MRECKEKGGIKIGVKEQVALDGHGGRIKDRDANRPKRVI